MNEKIEELKSALAELESEDGLVRFVGGHGIQSRFFAFVWRDERLEIDIRLPYARVLSDKQVQEEDAAKVGVAIRLSILLLVAEEEGRLLADGESRLVVEADESRFSYVAYGAAGTVCESGDEWEALVARLKSAFPGGGGGFQVILP